MEQAALERILAEIERRGKVSVEEVMILLDLAIYLGMEEFAIGLQTLLELEVLPQKEYRKWWFNVSQNFKKMNQLSWKERRLLLLDFCVEECTHQSCLNYLKEGNPAFQQRIEVLGWNKIHRG